MDGVLGIIFQRFYFSLGSSCIIMFYVLSTLLALRKAGFWFFPSLSLEFIKSSTAIWGFVCFVLIIGVFIEGLTHVCTNYYKENKCKFLKQNGKLNFIGKIIFFLMKPNSGEACKFYWKHEREKDVKFENSRFKFMYDTDTHERYNEDEVYGKMRINVLKIARIWEKGDIYRFRELSHMSRAMNVSFLLILSFSVLVTICVAIWCKDYLKTIGLFYLICIFVSAIFAILTELMACAFSKRYVCYVGELYEALGLHQRSAETAKAGVGGA